MCAIKCCSLFSLNLILLEQREMPSNVQKLNSFSNLSLVLYNIRKSQQKFGLHLGYCAFKTNKIELIKLKTILLRNTHD